MVADPPGPKIGNGGGSLHALQWLKTEYGDALNNRTSFCIMFEMIFRLDWLLCCAQLLYNITVMQLCMHPATSSPHTRASTLPRCHHTRVHAHCHIFDSPIFSFRIKHTLCNTVKVLLLNAGGFSKRLPQSSIIGKVFTAVPLGACHCLIACFFIAFVSVYFAVFTGPPYHVLELKLIACLDIPAAMSSGVRANACT